jgi:hypothetical protein
MNVGDVARHSAFERRLFAHPAESFTTAGDCSRRKKL